MAARPGSRSRRQSAREYPAPLILVCDDNAEDREMYATYFLAMGYRVQTATDGDMAFRYAVESRPDAIVMDLSMPRVDGWEATRRLKTDGRTRHIPVIACTGHAFGASVERALVVGCDAYVVKPCRPSDLLKEIRRLLVRAGDEQEQA
ncbi:MAG TPA: response regulator [Candidatus Binatia bacterium]|nr:response regulator [Candidatus Binatia bacterium]